MASRCEESSLVVHQLFTVSSVKERGAVCGRVSVLIPPPQGSQSPSILKDPYDNFYFPIFSIFRTGRVKNAEF